MWHKDLYIYIYNIMTCLHSNKMFFLKIIKIISCFICMYIFFLQVITVNWKINYVGSLLKLKILLYLKVELIYIYI